MALAQNLRAAHAEVSDFGEWDVAPSQLDLSWFRDAGLVVRSQGLVVDGASIGRTSGGPRLYDGFRSRPVASALMDDVELAPHAPRKPHAGIRVGLRVSAWASLARVRAPFWSLSPVDAAAAASGSERLGSAEDPRDARAEAHAWAQAVCRGPFGLDLARLSAASPDTEAQQAWTAWNKATESAICILRGAAPPPGARVPRGNVLAVSVRLSESQSPSALAALTPRELGVHKFDSAWQSLVFARHAYEWYLRTSRGQGEGMRGLRLASVLELARLRRAFQQALRRACKVATSVGLLVLRLATQPHLDHSVAPVFRVW